MLKILIDRIKWYLKIGESAQDAVDLVSEWAGISKDGIVYNYLLERAKELNQ